MRAADTIGRPLLTLSRPRVAVVAPSLDILGGQGVQAQTLVESLRADGWDVELVPINPRFSRGLGWLRSIPYARTLLNQLLYAFELGSLRRADIVHVFAASYWSFCLAVWPALLAARGMKKRVVLNYHSGEAADHLQHWGPLVHPWLQLADDIVVPSDYLSKVFARFGYQTRVIRNVVDLERFRYRERAPVAPRLLSNRNLETHYGVDNTLRAFARLKQRIPQATLTVAGYGSQRGALEALAKDLAVDVRFTGRVPPEAMPALYDEHDLFVNSSTIDNQPISILEACAAGLPVVSTPTGDIPSLVRHGESGLLVRPKDPEALAKAASFLIENPARALLMARTARRQVDSFRWPLVRGLWSDVYVGRDT
jgi:L-malate glycosyltransferase